MKTLFPELMNRLFYNMIHQLMWLVDKWWIRFPFSRVFFSGENCIWSPCFLFITEWYNLDASGETSSWIASVCSTIFSRGWCEYLASSHHRPVECTFSDETCSSTAVLIYFHKVHQFFLLNTFSFSSNLLYLSTPFLSVLTPEPSVISQLISKFLAVSCTFLIAVKAGYCKNTC